MRDKALDELITAEVSPMLAEAVQKLVKPSIRLRTLPPDGQIETLGRSWIGGVPLLPDSVPWPRVKNRPLQFVAQIDLGEAREHDHEERLPKDGHLVFFFDYWATSESVIYIPDGLAIRRREPPEDLPNAISPSWLGRLLFGRKPERTYRACRIKMCREMTAPDPMSFDLDFAEKEQVYSDEFYDKYAALRGDGESDARHQLLGNTWSIQGAYMEADCAGIKLAGGKLTENQVTELRKWKLLAQFDSDEHPGMMWGDLGRIFYYIHETDFANHDFTKVYVASQCY